MERAAFAPAEPVDRDVSEDSDQLLTPDELALRFNVKESWIYIKVEAGELPHVRLGRYLRFRREDVSAYLRSQQRGAETK